MLHIARIGTRVAVLYGSVYLPSAIVVNSPTSFNSTMNTGIILHDVSLNSIFWLLEERRKILGREGGVLPQRRLQSRNTYGPALYPYDSSPVHLLQSSYSWLKAICGSSHCERFDNTYVLVFLAERDVGNQAALKRLLCPLPK